MGANVNIKDKGGSKADEAVAAQALDGVAALSNHSSTTNSGGAIGPNQIVTWQSPPFASRHGKVLVMGNGGVQESLADTVVSAQLVRDPTAPTGATGTAIGSANEGESGHVAPFAATGSASFIDVVAPGSTHSWGLQFLGAAGTVTIPTSGASIILIDLP